MPVKLDALYYEVEARTTGFEQSLDEAGRRVEKLADFIKRKPAVAVGALVAAIVSVGAAATKMAADVEREGRKMGDVFPKVSRQVQQLSNDFGVAQTQIVGLYRALQARGERTPEGLNQTATAVLQLNQALRGTPEELEALGASLGDIRDLFNVDASQSGSLAATLFAMTDNRVPFQEFLGDLEAAAPVIRQYGLSLNEVGPALIAFREQGLSSSKQVASALKDELRQGTAGLREYSDGAVNATAAQEAFNAQLERTGSEMGVAGARIREQFNNTLIDLGERILPTVIRMMENVVALMDKASGRQGAFDSLDALVGIPLNPNRGLNDRGRRQASGAFRNLQEQIGDGDFRLAELQRGQLEALARSLRGLSSEFRNAPELRREMQAMLTEVDKLLSPAPGGSTVPAAGDRAGPARGTGEGPPTKIRIVTSNLEALAYALGSFATEQLAAVANQINNAAYAQAEFNKALEEAGRETADAKNQVRAREAKDDAQLQEALNRIKENARSTPRQVQAMARSIEQAVEGTLDLANAFGLVDDATKNVLSNIGQVAAGIGPLVNAIDNMGSGRGSSLSRTAGLIGAALPVIGGVAQLVGSLFGESPEEKARRAAIEQNNRLIEELNRNIGDLGLAITGTQYTSARGITGSFDVDPFRHGEAPTSRPGTDAYLYELTRYQNVDRDELEASLRAQGTSRQELQDLADQLGLEVDFFSGQATEVERAFRTLNEALAAIELTKFAQTFEGQMQAFNAALSLFDVEDPLGKMSRLLEVIRSGVGSPGLAGAFAGLDITSAQGRAEAERRLQELFAQLQAGTLDPSQLGGMTGEQFLNMLVQLEELLDEIGGAADAGASQSWVVNRSITEVRGARLESLLGSIDLWGRETAENTALIADLLSMLVIGGGNLVPPAPGADGGYASRGGIQIGSLVIQVAPGVDAAAAGTAAAEAFVAGVDRVMGTRSTDRVIAVGEAS